MSTLRITAAFPGGGIWFSRCTLLPGMGIESLEPEPAFLAGVAFYQTGEDSDGYRGLIAHGPISIYDHISAP